MRTLGIIPARSGSKGLVDKNIKLINNKPLIAYTIEAAKVSGAFDTVMVSTDCEKYATIAKEYGAEVPFLRSKETSSDTASTRDAVLEVLREYSCRGVEYDRLMILQPTSPLRTPQNILDSIRIFEEKNAKGVISVCEVEHSPLWCNTLPDNLSLNGFINEESNVQRQKLDTYYRINGAIYLFSVDYYKATEHTYDEYAYAYIMDKAESVDVDDSLDFDLVQTLLAR